MVHAEVGGRLLHVQDTGGEGPPVVLCHARGDDSDSFAAQAEQLGDVYRLIRFDQRGHGRSEDDQQPWSPWTAAGDLYGILDLLGIERAVVVGDAEGALVAVGAALQHPDRARALALLDTPSGLAADPELGNRLDELAMPVVLVRGVEVAEGADVDRRVCTEVSDCRGVVPIERAGRAAHRSRPAAVSDALRGFLEGLPA